MSYGKIHAKSLLNERLRFVEHFFLFCIFIRDDQLEHELIVGFSGRKGHSKTLIYLLAFEFEKTRINTNWILPCLRQGAAGTWRS